MVDTSNDWIVDRTGIRERRIASDDEATSDLAFMASQMALKDAGIKPEDLDFIIVATVTPDYVIPLIGLSCPAETGRSGCICL